MQNNHRWRPWSSSNDRIKIPWSLAPSYHSNQIFELGKSCRHSSTGCCAHFPQMALSSWPYQFSHTATHEYSRQSRRPANIIQACFASLRWLHTWQASPRTFSCACWAKRVSTPGLFFHCDISGPFQVLSHGGHSYFITFKYDHSSFRFVFFMTNRSEALSKFKILYKLAKKKTGHSLSKLRSDSGREFLSKDFQDFVQLKGIRHELTAPYTPEQNSVVERDNRTVVESVRSMLHHYSMPLPFWGEAINTAVYILNRVSSMTLHGDTPYTKWYGIKPDVSHFRVFGGLCYAHIPKPLRKKLDSKARECIFVGYCTTSKACRLWCPRKKKIVVARDVIFDEDISSHFSSLPHTSSPSSTFLPNYSLIFPHTSSVSQLSLPANPQSSGSSIGVSSSGASSPRSFSPGVSSSSSARVSSSSSQVGDFSVSGVDFPEDNSSVGEPVPVPIESPLSQSPSNSLSSSPS